MIIFFFTCLFAGHIYILIAITAVQIISFKEVIAIANVPSRARSLRFTKTLNWYFLGTTMYFLYGESVVYYFKHIVLVDKVLLPFATHHRFISFMLYVIGMLLLTVRTWPGRVLTDGRFRLLCHIAAEGALQISVYPICMDAYGSVPHSRPGALCYEQRLRGHDMVLLASCPRHHKRHFCLHLWHDLWSHAAYSVVTKENSRRLPWRMDLHHSIRRLVCQPHGEIQVFHLPGQCRSSLCSS